MPFITHEAEAVANKTTGTRVAVKEKPTAATSTPELEASGRAFVALDATGEYLDIPVTRAADGLVLRHCIPDAPSGGGATATLSLYVNGKFRQSLTLSSRYNWLYGHDNNRNGQSNDPAAGTPHVFWDDTRFRITGGVAPGDTLRLQKDERDTAAFYRIDLVDLEAVPLPLAPPPTGTFLSVVDFGATANDETDDTPALLKCIEAARVAKKTVWVPSGSFQHTQKFTLDGVAVQGAGMWHTTLVGIRGQHGFMLRGKNPRISDLTIEST
ncbi:MAG: glycosyl hydrolase family 28-related protein, partial [Verrucomicrobiota bacterium]